MDKQRHIITHISSRSLKPHPPPQASSDHRNHQGAMLQNTLSHLQNPNHNMLLTPTLAPSSHSLFFSSSSSAFRFTATPPTLLPPQPTRFSLPSPISSYAYRGRGQGRGRGRGRGGTTDYERRPMFKWNEIYKRISLAEGPEIEVSGVLDQLESEGKTFAKWELCRAVRELRKFRKYKVALEIYEWMSNRRERFSLFSSDMAIQLDLIAKVHGISGAEEFFIRIPEVQKDNRVYGALLNAYVGAKSKEKAELLMNTLRDKGYASESLAYNVMMTLYMKLREYEKVDLLITELKQKNIPLDIYSYNIWLSARGSLGSVDLVEEVFEEMKRDETVNPTWSTFGTMATLYIRLGHLEKAEECLKDLESRIVGRNRLPYHYLLNLYGSVGNKTEVHRIWSLYKSLFFTSTNWGYHAVINSLVRVGDIEGAEKLYEEWLSVKTMHDTRITNILLNWYVNEGHYEKAESFFGRLGETGGNPVARTWEILAACNIKQKRISDALSCFRQASSTEGTDSWKPRPINISSFLELCEQEGDETSKEDLVGLLRQIGCFMDETYRSVVSEYVGADLGDDSKQSTGDYVSGPGDENGDIENEGSEMLFSMTE